MENVKNVKNANEKKEIKTVDETVLKPKSEMTVEDIKKLPVYNIAINSRLNIENGEPRFTNIQITLYLNKLVNLKLAPMYGNTSKSVEPLTEKEFKYFKYKLGVGEKVNCFDYRCPVRFVKGVNKNGNEFYRVDLFLMKDLTKSIWVDKLDVEMLKRSDFDMTVWLTVETDLADNFNADIDELFK